MKTYNLLKSIYYLQLPLFKNYLIWKCFYSWYKYISRNKFYWAREELLIVFDRLRHATVNIFNIILETTEMIIIYDSSITEENTLQGFKEQQVSHEYILFIVFKVSEHELIL